MIFEQNKKYRVTAEGFALALLTNELLKNEIEKEGFANVVVTGNGAKRIATGHWPHATQAKQFSPVVKSVIKKIEQI